MSLGDAFQADVDQALDLSAKQAPVPDMPKPRGLWRAAADSLIGAGAKMQASALEVGKVIGPALTFAADPSNAEALDQIKQPPDFRQNELSKPFRDFEKGLRPDPATAGKAEQVVYGVVGPMATLVGGTLLGGLPGLGAVAAETGFSQSEDLAQQGVDLKTRTAVGTLTAGVTAGTALLPMAGQTLKQTAGLYLLGGPGQFMAQQAATREILRAADYDTIAQQFDPFDPVGLTLSAVIPAPFAAWGVRGNLKAMKGQKPAAEPVRAPAAPRGTPPEPPAGPSGGAPVASGTYRDGTKWSATYRTVERSDGTHALVRDFTDDAGTKTQHLTLEGSWADGEPATTAVSGVKQLIGPEAFPDAEAALKFAVDTENAKPAAPADPVATPEQVDAAMAHNLTLQRDVHEATPPAKVAAEVVRPVVTETPAFREWFGASKVVDEQGSPVLMYRGTTNADMSANPAGMVYVTPDPSFASIYANKDGGAVFPVYVRAENVIDTSRGQGLALLKEFNAEQGKQWFDNTAGTERGALINWQQEQAFRQWLDSKGIEYDALWVAESNGKASLALRNVEQLRSALMLDNTPESAPVLDAATTMPASKPEPETVTKAKQAAEQMQASGQKLEDFTASAKLPPDVQNLLIGLSEAGKDLDRAARLLDDFARTSEMQPGRSPTDIAADVVEAAREGRTVTPEPAKPAPATPEKATAESVSNRLQELEATAPDMVVRISDDGKPVTLADELARIRREAAEGTDTELGANEAGLLKVAADCALSTGAP